MRLLLIKRHPVQKPRGNERNTNELAIIWPSSICFRRRGRRGVRGRQAGRLARTVRGSWRTAARSAAARSRGSAWTWRALGGARNTRRRSVVFAAKIRVRSNPWARSTFGGSRDQGSAQQPRNPTRPHTASGYQFSPPASSSSARSRRVTAPTVATERITVTARRLRV